MKLRYYLRGLGIGILITVVILTISGLGKDVMTDEEIKERAKELGMVESTVLSGMNTPAPSEEPEATASPEPSEEPEATASPAPSEEPEATASPAPSKEPEVTPSPSTEENINEESEETVTIVISAGDSSVSVSKDLEAAGLIESASAYDKYLCDNGYDRKIRIGTFKIPVGSNEEEIAWIITHKQ